MTYRKTEGKDISKAKKKKGNSGEIRFIIRFSTIWYKRDGEITVDNIIMIFMDIECFKEV